MDEIDALLDAMALEEQVAVLSGEDFWSLPAVPRLGIGMAPDHRRAERRSRRGSLIGGVRSASFPVGIALGATWDPRLLREIGAALAEKARSKGAHVLLGPTMNIQRSVTNRRNSSAFPRTRC